MSGLVLGLLGVGCGSELEEPDENGRMGSESGDLFDAGGRTPSAPEPEGDDTPPRATDGKPMPPMDGDPPPPSGTNPPPPSGTNPSPSETSTSGGPTTPPLSSTATTPSGSGQPLPDDPPSETDGEPDDSGLDDPGTEPTDTPNPIPDDSDAPGPDPDPDDSEPFDPGPDDPSTGFDDEPSNDEPTETDPPDETDPTGPTEPLPPAGPPIRASELVDFIGGGNFDPFALPSTLEAADDQSHVTLMQSFGFSIGNCESCHVEDAEAPTAAKTVARHMWEDILTKVTLKDGGALYCDSCHQGEAKFLDRSNLEAVELWMQENMVDKLIQRNGEPVDCATCHGEPADYDLISTWTE